MGDKAKAADLKAITGNLRVPMDRGTKPIETPVITTPRAPRELGYEARKEWRRVAPILTDLKLLTPADLGILEAYCETFGLWRETGARLRKLRAGSTTPAVSSDEKALHAIATRARGDMMKLAGELGLTPTSRGRVNVDHSALPSEHEKIRKYLG